MKYKNKSIFYVNYSPYENSGHILQYLVKNFKYVYTFSIGFHDLGVKRGSNKLIIYKYGKKIKQRNYLHIKSPKRMEYLFIPIRSLVNLCQFFSISNNLYKDYGPIDIFFSVNAFVAWTGLVLKGFKRVKKTVFWVWDYYPLVHKNLIILLMRWLYWQFDRVAMFSDKVIFLNEKIANLHKKSGMFLKNLKYSIIPIGTSVGTRIRSANFSEGRLNISFLGVVKKSQGLGFLLDSEESLVKKFPKIQIDVLGGGPDLDFFLKKSKNSKMKINFHGLLDEKRVNSTLLKSDIGIATYIPDKSNVSYFGDPSKVKKYLSLGIPVITTDVFDFSQRISKHRAGFVVKYGKKADLVRSIKKILKNHKKYSDGAYNLSKEFNYKKIYKQMFKF